MAQINIKKTDTLQTPTSGSAGVGVKESNELFIVSDTGEEIPVGGLEGTQYTYVQANGTDTENATELQDAYNTAKTMSPSATNRITVICGNGNYNFSSNFVMDTQYIDLVSLDGNRSIIFNGTGTINITANDVFVKGVDVGNKNFTIATNLNLLRVENCVGGTNSFGAFGTTSGTFTNCQGGDKSFAGDGTASGTFTNCVGSNNSFGGFGGTASGTFTNCQGASNSFGGFNGTASGTFTNCQSNESSFSNGGTASGTFTNCQGGFDSFGGVGGNVSGTFTYCQGDGGSFGIHGTLSGKLYYCRLKGGIFETPSQGGKIVLGINGNNNIINS